MSSAQHDKREQSVLIVVVRSADVMELTVVIGEHVTLYGVLLQQIGDVLGVVIVLRGSVVV